MTTLVAILSSGKGTWSQVNSLISAQNWEKIILFCNEYAYKNYENTNSNILKLQIQEQQSQEFIDKIAQVLHNNVKDLEIALNLISGSGVEHMSIIGGVIKAGLGFRLVAFHRNEFIEYKLYQTPELLGEDE